MLAMRLPYSQKPTRPRPAAHAGPHVEHAGGHYERGLAQLVRKARAQCRPDRRSLISAMIELLDRTPPELVRETDDALHGVHATTS